MEHIRTLILISLAAMTTCDYIQTPGGWLIHKTCQHEILNGAVVNLKEIPQCPFPSIPPPSHSQSPQWYGYPMDTSFQISNITQMSATWTVPGLPPTQQDQIIRIWPGLKNEQPAIGYPTLLTLLVYNGLTNPYWILQSYFVWSTKSLYISGNSITVSPGDIIETTIHYNPINLTWEVLGFNVLTKETSVLIISRSQMEELDFGYAMLTMEIDISDSYPDQCILYPGNNPKLLWSNITVNDQRPQWIVTVTRKDCDQSVALESDGSVEFGWRN